MEKPKNSKSTFRQRGYTCSACGMGTMHFGSDVDPTVCPSCNAEGALKKDWDHVVTNTTHVEASPSAV